MNSFTRFPCSVARRLQPKTSVIRHISGRSGRDRDPLRKSIECDYRVRHERDRESPQRREGAFAGRERRDGDSLDRAPRDVADIEIPQCCREPDRTAEADHGFDLFDRPALEHKQAERSERHLLAVEEAVRLVEHGKTIAAAVSG